MYVPSWIPDDRAADNIVCLLAEAAECARGRNIHFLQAIIPLEASMEQEVYRQGGFEELAELIYMESDLTRPLRADEPPPPLEWVTYSPETHAFFAQTVLDTYNGSLDCVRLNGLRDIDDILASHRATGVFNPRTWLVGLASASPVGVLLLSKVPDQPTMEVVYMGVMASCRGRGYARALLTRGVRIARDLAALRLTLAVDALNLPARKLYARFGFCETSRRSAWIRFLDSPAPPASGDKNAGS